MERYVQHAAAGSSANYGYEAATSYDSTHASRSPRRRPLHSWLRVWLGAWMREADCAPITGKQVFGATTAKAPSA